MLGDRPMRPKGGCAWRYASLAVQTKPQNPSAGQRGFAFLQHSASAARRRRGWPSRPPTSCATTIFNDLHQGAPGTQQKANLGSGVGFDCKFHGRFKVSGTVLAQAKKRTRRQWEHALMLAKARVSDGLPLISSELL
jgi:hypothetical protein